MAETQAIDTQAFLTRWHAMWKAHDRLALDRLVTAEAVLVGPNQVEPRPGKPYVVRLLDVLLFAPEKIGVLREWVDADTVVIAFAGIIEGLQVDGMLHATLDDNADLKVLSVLVRPAAAAIDLERRAALDEAEVPVEPKAEAEAPPVSDASP